MPNRRDLEKEIRTKPDRLLTHSGLDLTLKPVPQVVLQAYLLKAESEAREAGWAIDPPTYQLTVGGPPEFYQSRGQPVPVEEYPHAYDPENGVNTLDVEDSEETRRNWAAWRAHQDALKRLEAIQEDRATLANYVFGVDIKPDQIPDEDDPEWVSLEDTLDIIGLEMPEKRRERLGYWLLYGGKIDLFESQLILAKIQFLTIASSVEPDDVTSFLRRVTAAMDQRAKDAMADAIAGIESIVADADESD